MTSEPTLISSVRRALRLLETVGAQERPVSAKQLARQTGLRLPTTYHLLRTLVHEGYLRKLDDGYVLGDSVDLLGHPPRNQLLLNRIRPILTALRDELGAAAYVSIFDDGEIRILDIVDSASAPRVDLWVGCTEAGHATALGKCVLRELPDHQLRDYLARHPLVDLTPRTATKPQELRRRLAAGPIMLDREEYSLGTACAAVPIYDGARPGSLSVSVPVGKLDRLERGGQRLLAASEQINRAMSLTI
ncbi:IclR family transcriptional regulator [Tamaricihabitans halophyticus]|uniref:Glycerol operon regulatory protein n=1 Tax=Tamaricihabitans halophyticus TaxID=1262583 RepID=A0A4R2R664_9PSEU|nr:IclR family transcriptional regulator [Tamaricihabitans halophyticus]TCP57339.1 IclR family transcriptional regulator [Tamaricihabitans halophyticus]